MREDDILPYDVGGNRTKRLQDKRGITYTDVRLRGGGRKTIANRVTPFRHTDEAAKSRRLPREWLDIGGRACFNYFRTAEVEGRAPGVRKHSPVSA